MSRDSTMRALMRHHARESKRTERPHRKNKKPEFEFKKLAVKWLEDNGFSMDVVESKATYNFAAGRYDHGQTEAGFSDLVGVTPYYGVAAFIELKAPGRRSSLKPHQRIFLLDKIKAGAFACCVDSIEALDATYNIWLGLRQQHKLTASFQYLVDVLPKSKELTDNLADITG